MADAGEKWPLVTAEAFAPPPVNGTPPAANGTPRPVGSARPAPVSWPDALFRYQQLFAFLPDGYLVTDLCGNVRDANRAALELLGRPREFVVGKPLPVFIAGDQRLAFYARLNKIRALAGGEHAEVTLQRRDGTRAVADTHVTVLSNTEGKPHELLWNFRDVTAAKHAEAQLRAERQVTDSLITTAQVIILTVNSEGHILRHNAYLEETTGFRAEELRKRVWWECLVPAAEQAQAREWFLRIAARRVNPPEIRSLWTRRGVHSTVAWYGAELPSFNGSGSTVLLIGHNVTQLHAAQQQVLQSERLATIGRMTAVITHESRNAIQRTHACLERLAWKVEDRPEALDLLRRAQQAQEDLRHLFDDVRAYAAPVRLDFRRCDVAEVWREAWMEVSELQPERDAALDEQLASTDRHCRADPFRLGQVFRNLFENALAACPDPVRVTVACGDTEHAGRPALCVVVCDNGPGLTEEQRRNVFVPFFTTKTKGTGLGLAIARRIVGVHDTPGKPGAEFFIVLPRSPTHDPPPTDRGRG